MPKAETITNDFVLRYFYDLKREVAVDDQHKLVSLSIFLAREQSLELPAAEQLGTCLIRHYTSPVELINDRAQWSAHCPP